MLTSPPSLPVPRIQLAQVGQWKVPAWDFSTKLQVEVKEATTEMYRGATYDFDAGRRADLQPIRVTHDGAYHCCGNPRQCNWAISEWDGIVRNMGVRTPILFYRFPYCIDCPEDCYCDSLYHGEPCYNCNKKKPCGEWLWAYGTVTSITNDISADDFKTPKTATTTLELRLEGPLQLATHRRWLYAPKLEITQPCTNLEDAAALVDYNRRTFAAPCGPLDCCGRWRFWPRNLNAECCECDWTYDPRFWESRYVWGISSDTCFNLYVPGQTAPHVQAILSSGFGGSVTVRNAVGTNIFAYSAAGSIYTNTETGLVWRDNGSGYSLLAAASDVIRLEPGENIITTSGTALTLGVTPLWVN